MSHLVKDPVAVERSLANLAQVLVTSRDHMMHLGRPDLADRLDHLAADLEAHGESIDDALYDAFVDVTGDAADACVEAAGSDGMGAANPNTDTYTVLSWCLMDLVVVRIGGYGTIEHPTNSSH